MHCASFADLEVKIKASFFANFICVDLILINEKGHFFIECIHCACFADLEVKIKLSFFAPSVQFGRHSSIIKREVAVKMSARKRVKRACSYTVHKMQCFMKKAYGFYLTTPDDIFVFANPHKNALKLISILRFQTVKCAPISLCFFGIPCAVYLLCHCFLHNN